MQDQGERPALPRFRHLDMRSSSTMSAPLLHGTIANNKLLISPSGRMQGWDPVTSASQFWSFAEQAPLACVYFTAPW